jgi:hypothetical protein
MKNFDSDELIEAFGAVIEDQTRRFYQQPIPCELDHKVSNLVRLVRGASQPALLAFLAHDKEGFSWRLLVFADRMASLAVRENSRDRVLEGLHALIVGYKVDMRDAIAVMAVLHDAATKVGASPDELFLEAAALGDNSAARAIAEFTKRTPNNKSLKVFPSYKEGKDKDGFRYIQGG